MDSKIEEYKNKYISMAASTTPGDRDILETAALRLAEMGELGDCVVRFIKNPGNCISSWYWGTLHDKFRNSIDNDILFSVDESTITLVNSGLFNKIESFVEPVCVTSVEGFSPSIPYGSLDYSLWDIPWNIPDLAYWTFMSEELGVKYSDRCAELISLYEIITEHAFAIWVAPCIISICEKPTNVEIKDNQLVSMTWGEEINPNVKRIKIESD